MQPIPFLSRMGSPWIWKGGPSDSCHDGSPPRDPQAIRTVAGGNQDAIDSPGGSTISSSGRVTLTADRLKSTGINSFEIPAS
jgi:hypothetical protein